VRIGLCVGLAVCAVLLVGPAEGGPASPLSKAMRFIDAPPPPSRAPRAGPVNLSFVSARVGFSATTGGLRGVGRLGIVPAIDLARIERTDDGGITWRSVWSKRGIVFGSISALGNTVVAFGRSSRLVVNRRKLDWHLVTGNGVLLVSQDGGRSWEKRRPPFNDPDRVEVVSPTVWILGNQLNWDATHTTCFGRWTPAVIGQSCGSHMRRRHSVSSTQWWASSAPPVRLAQA
jgi:hypothetical protein